jgi:translation elongation factor EF-Ts
MYLVVFQRNQKAGSLAGLVFMIEYESEEDFVTRSNQLSEEVSSTRDIIAQGVSQEEADLLIRLSEIPSRPCCLGCADCPCEH